MARLSPQAYREVKRRLESVGFVETSQKGSHVKFVRRAESFVDTTIVPKKAEISIGTLRSILSQAHIDLEQWSEAMKSYLSINEHDLVQFFSNLPTQLDEGVPWEYNDSVYEASDSRIHVSFAVSPAARDVRILLSVDGICIYELNAMGVDDISYRREKGRESVEVIVAHGHSVWLTVKPQVLLHQSIS